MAAFELLSVPLRVVANVPRVWCREDGVHLITELPWASAGSGFTLLFEAFVMLLAEQMPVAAIARVVQEEDTRLWRLISRLVEAAHVAADWSQVSSIAIDDTSARRGRCYVSVFLDAKTHRLLYVAPGHTSLAIEQFAQALIAHCGDPRRIEWVAMHICTVTPKGIQFSLEFFESPLGSRGATR